MLPRSHSARNCGTTAVAENHVVIESTSAAASSASALRERCPHERRSVEDDRFLVHDRRPEPGERLVLPHLDHLDLGGDLVAGPHRRLEAPVDVQEHASRPGQVLGHDRVQQSRGHAALDDQPAEARPGSCLLVVVERIPVTGQLGEELDVPFRHPAAAAGDVADLSQ